MSVTRTVTSRRRPAFPIQLASSGSPIPGRGRHMWYNFPEPIGCSGLTPERFRALYLQRGSQSGWLGL
jgi:hypothetical protein